MTADPKINFEIQKLTVNNDSWAIELWFESIYAENRFVESENYSKTIDLSDKGESGSLLAIFVKNKQQNNKSCLITGIDGGSYLHTAGINDNSQTVKLLGDNLILSLGATFFSYNLNKQEINWKVNPDTAAVFEFYDLQDDYLLRGEMEIHRIDRNGKVKWSYGGRDIWVNVDGKKEVSIDDDKIRLTDFAGNIYVIDFNGKTLEDIPVVSVKESRKKWWELWR